VHVGGRGQITVRRSGLSTACLAVVMAWSCRNGAPRRPARTANDGPIAGRAAVEDLVLGQSEGDSGVTFSGIVAVHVDGRGNIYVLDNGDRAIQVFSPDGRHLRAIGGNGSGPGEFRDPAGFSVLGDSLLVTYDRVLQRLTWFGMDGQLVATRSVKLPMMQYGLVGDVRGSARPWRARVRRDHGIPHQAETRQGWHWHAPARLGRRERDRYDPGI
jgi:hypothetical protein